MTSYGEGVKEGEHSTQTSGPIYAIRTGPMQTNLLIIIVSETSSGFSKMNQKLSLAPTPSKIYIQQFKVSKACKGSQEHWSQKSCWLGDII